MRVQVHQINITLDKKNEHGKVLLTYRVRGTYIARRFSVGPHGQKACRPTKMNRTEWLTTQFPTDVYRTASVGRYFPTNICWTARETANCPDQ